MKSENTMNLVSRGFASLPCILCGNTDDNVLVRLSDVTQFHCDSCEESFDADAVRLNLLQWQAVLMWLDMAPIAAK